MQVLISLETVICFHLKYTIDFEKVINTANLKKKKNGRVSVVPVHDFSNADIQYESSSTELFVLRGSWAGWGPRQHPAALWGSEEDALGPGPEVLGSGLDDEEFSTLSLYVSATETQLDCFKEGADG